MRKKNRLNILGLRDLVYGSCAAIVLGCLLIAVIVLLHDRGV